MTGTRFCVEVLISTDLFIQELRLSYVQIQAESLGKRDTILGQYCGTGQYCLTFFNEKWNCPENWLSLKILHYFTRYNSWNWNNPKMASDWNLLILVSHRILVRSD